MSTVPISLASIVISVTTFLLARRNYLRTKAHLKAVEARYPHLADRAAEK